MTELQKASESAIDQFALTFNSTAKAIQNAMRFVVQAAKVLCLALAAGFALLDEWLSKPGWPDAPTAAAEMERR